ncbi:unnamed protein product [Rhizophagus irregularis]|nr:unnamed protein product [Rhizophagus irregularis]
MENKLNKPNILDKNANTVNTKNCLYCNKIITEELFCKECINSVKKLAGNGDEVAMFNLAICYKNGEGIEKNLEKAFYWFQKAAENAICYENGEGTEKNSKKAFHWYHKAAENSNERAMFNLAICYENGIGTEKNLEKVFYW